MPPRSLAVVPLLWALVGSSAAFALGVHEDLALIVVAASGVPLLTGGVAQRKKSAGETGDGRDRGSSS